MGPATELMTVSVTPRVEVPTNPSRYQPAPGLIFTPRSEEVPANPEPVEVKTIHKLETVSVAPETVPTNPCSNRTNSVRLTDLASKMEALELAEYRRTQRGKPRRRVSDRSSLSQPQCLKKKRPKMKARRQTQLGASTVSKSKLSGAAEAGQAVKTKSNSKLAKLDKQAASLKQKIDRLILRRDEAHANDFDSPLVKKLSMQVITFSKKLAKVSRERYNMRSRAATLN